MADADPKLTPRTEGRVKAQLNQNGSRTVAALGGAAGRSKELVATSMRQLVLTRLC